MLHVLLLNRGALLLDEDVDHANSIVRADPVFQACRKQRALPAIRALAAELQVGRHTVEEAYAELTAEGLLEARIGQGTFVAAPWAGRSAGTAPPRSAWSRPGGAARSMAIGG